MILSDYAWANPTYKTVYTPPFFTYFIVCVEERNMGNSLHRAIPLPAERTDLE